MSSRVAYFSSEIALKDSLPSFSGGLGVLSGDHVRVANDMGVPLVGVTLLHKNGYFHQKFDQYGNQQEMAETYNPAQDPEAEKLPLHVKVHLCGRDVGLQVWKYNSGSVPVYMLDPTGNGNGQDVEGKVAWLYQGDSLMSEALLGIGGHALVKELYGDDIGTYHMNESQTAFLALSLLKDLGSVDAVRERAVFTTHSPVAGHAHYSYEDAGRVFNGYLPHNIRDIAGRDCLDMTQLALNTSRFTNGVAKKHAETSSKMFGRKVAAITNGVHSYTWASPDIQVLFDEKMPAWRRDPSELRKATEIDAAKMEAAHAAAKLRMINYVEAKTGVRLDKDQPVITFARRMTGYKRPDLLFSDIERLKSILKDGGQVVYAGKVHPHDSGMKNTVAGIHQKLKALRDAGINAAYVPNYVMETCKILAAGSDVWLNNPEIPWEASGTSGMCAAVNGVPQLSTLDGWWPEGHEEGVTGWSIGGASSNVRVDADDLYRKLPDILSGKSAVDPRVVIARNGVEFSAHRMMSQYLDAYNHTC